MAAGNLIFVDYSMDVYGNIISLYIELSNSYLIGQKRTVNFQNQHS